MFSTTSSHRSEPRKSLRAWPLLVSLLSVWILFAPGTSMAALCGDCDHDGAITIADALLVAQHATSPFLTGPQLLECDVNRSGGVTIVDALLLAQTAAGLMTTPLACIDCGDCNLDTFIDGLDLTELQNRLGTQVTNAQDAACDTNGDGRLDDLDEDAYVMGTTYRCTTCGDCDLNGVVNDDDATRAAFVATLPPFPPGCRVNTACDVTTQGPAGISIFDALAIANFTAGVTGTLGCVDPAAAPPLPHVAASPTGFCLYGESTGTTWDAEVSFGGTTANIGPQMVPAPGSAAVMADTWALAIDALADFSAQSFGNCFTAEHTATRSVPDIRVITASTSCWITAAGCNYNPKIFEDPLEGDLDGDDVTDGEEIRGGTDPENSDSDGDGAADGTDNCPTIANPKQEDGDDDGTGDACETAPSAPDARDDFVLGTAGEPATAHPTANDLDADGDLDPSSLQILQGTEHGELVVKDDGQVVFVPDPNFLGAVQVRYGVCDSEDLCDEAWIGWVILPADSNSQDPDKP